MWDDILRDHSLEAYLRRRTVEELYQIRTLDDAQQDPDVITLVDGILQERENTPAECELPQFVRTVQKPPLW